MQLRGLVNSLVILMIVGGLLFNLEAAPTVLAEDSAKIEASLLSELSTNGQADFIIRFKAQADLAPAYTLAWKERGAFVVDVLTETAEKSQAQAKGILNVAGFKYQTFIAGNELYVWQGDVSTAGDVAALPEVESIRQTRTYSLGPVMEVDSSFTQVRWAGDLLAANFRTWVGETPSTLAWGISYTKANDFWAQFDLQGDGIVVANIDTGVQWNHPALDQSFRCGTDPTDPRCWADPANICGGSACDNNGHGTHTMGTMVADDDPALTYQAGMAPNAKWITCKGCESTTCSDYALNACGDWLLAPGGSSDNRPHVVNNSWGGEGGDIWYKPRIEAWVAAGIFPAFSAGNNGPSCETLGSPGDYQISFSSAANDPLGNAGTFSSRGPSIYGHDPYTKPNITAPGVNICSTYPENTWTCGYSGTSMASPHTAGAVALLWSCNPGLVGDISSTFQALQSTANPAPSGSCGAPPDGEGNYTFGYGYLDVLSAGVFYCSNIEKGYLEGYVTDLETGEPIEGAMLDASSALVVEQQINAVTDPSGYYSMTLPVGTFDITASKTGYSAQTFSVSIINGSTKQQDFELQWVGTWMQGPADPNDFMRYDCTWFDDGTGVSTYNQKVYCMGGRTDYDTESSAIWRFDPVTESFIATGDTLYESISNYTANVVKDANGWAIYVISGFDLDNLGGVVDYVQRYEPSDGSLQLISTDPSPIRVAGELATPGACVSVNNKIYCFGGWEGKTAPYFGVETWEFDPDRPAGSRWERILTADLAVGRGYIQAAVQNDIIYAMGGVSGYSGGDLIPSDVVEALNLNDLTAGWSVLDPLPVATGEGRGFGFDVDSLATGTQNLAGKLYVVGGGDWPSESTEVLEYDVLNGSWSQDFPELLAARREHAGVYIPLCTEDPTDGLPAMWVFGGRQGTDEKPYLEPEYFPLECVIPQIEVVKTVGLDASTCATSDHVDVITPTEVTYCFTLNNTTALTLTEHDLKDSHLGTLLSNYPEVLAPGESFFITKTVTVSTTIINVVEWTATDENENTYVDYDYAVLAMPGSYYTISLPVIYHKH